MLCAGAKVIAKLRRAGVSIHGPRAAQDRRADHNRETDGMRRRRECAAALPRPRAAGAQRKVGSARHDFKGRAAFNVFL